VAASIIDIVQEEFRQAVTGDKHYFKKEPYAFVLKGKPMSGPLGPSGKAVFPMVMNPESFEYSLPFAAEITPLQEGGVVAEEGGIVIGEINIVATTGWKLRTTYDTSWGGGDGEFSGLLGLEGGVMFHEVSGQLAFWRLLNRCFDAYSAFKKDPQTAAAAVLEFHSMKDDLHLTVIPREFTLRREAARERVTYRYTARLAVVGPASDDLIVLGPDVSLLQSIKNAISKVRSTIQSVAAAVDDVTAAIGELRRTITSIAGVLDDVASVVDSFTDMINGVKSFADIPGAFITSTANLLDSTAEFIGTIEGFPADVEQTFRNLSDDCDRLKVAAANLLREDFDERARKYEKRTTPPRIGDDPTRDALAGALALKAASAGGTLKVAEVFGGAVKPGDVTRSRAQPFRDRARLQQQKYQGFEERVVGQGATMQSLAARYLGRAKDWILIAEINQLQAPYITSGAKIPHTLQPGSRFIIPIADPSRSPDVITTGEASLGESQADKHLGTDFELVQLKKATGARSGTFGWAIDEAGGAVDVRFVSGFKNLSQAIESRFRTERATNILYPAIGLPRLVGVKGLGENIVEARYEARNQLLADSRVARIGRFSFTQDQDVLTLEADVQPKGFNTTRLISRTLT
jgi:hypothetical protein